MESYRICFRQVHGALFVLVGLLTLQPNALTGQMNMAGHGMETQDEIPPEQLPSPRKLTGIGNVHMKITATPEAQVWFDQGLNLLHDFWDYESARAFEQSVRVDPRCAMCYWGLYQAESFYHSLAKGYAAKALDEAVSLESQATKRERLYIEATAAARDDQPRAMTLGRELLKKYPHDTQTRILFGRALGQKESIAILESVLKDSPEDSAANHYYIHALEGTDHPEKASHSAEILARLAPASGHMVHMPGHIFFRLGDYARAEQAFAASREVDERYMREQHVRPDNDWNYVHNLMYAVANLLEEGKLNEATELSTKLSGARGDLESTLYIYSTRDSISRLDPYLPVALRTGDWGRVIHLLRARRASGHEPNLDFLAEQLTSFATGMQDISIGDLKSAEEVSMRLDAALWRKSAESKDSKMQSMQPDKASPGAVPKLQVRPDAMLQPLLATLSIMSLELRGSLLTTKRNISEAKALFQTAAQQEKSLGYHEPPNYIRPVGEAEGAAMMAAGEWAAAKDAYERALVERPRSGLALYGIALVSEKAGDSTAASKAFQEFLAAWKSADPGLAQLTHAREFTATHPGAHS